MISGADFKKLREANHITQEKIMAIANVSKLTIRKFENEVTKNPKLETVEKLEEALDTLLLKIKNPETNVVTLNKPKRMQTVRAIISYETKAEAIIEIEETTIDEENHITQRKYGTPEIKKVIEINKDKYKIIRTLEEGEIFPGSTK